MQDHSKKLFIVFALGLSYVTFSQAQEPSATIDELDSIKAQPMDTAKQDKPEKLAEDPTKVVTQVGVSYADSVRFSGSFSLGPVNKINASIDADGEQWRVGGSWLFDVGIVNVNMGKKEFDDGTTQNNYSIGTFVPLSYFGFEPWNTQIFAMAGYTYNDGRVACDTKYQQCGTDFDVNDMSGSVAFIPSTSSSGYAGFFALKPLSDKWRLLGVAAGSLGSNDYSGTLFAAGAGYSITEQQSISAYGFVQDNSYGHDEQLGIAYKYQFD